jgi:peptide subunit release factor 1 (eRF1)
MNDFEKVQRLFDAYRSGGLAVVGSQDTLEALSMGQVEELLITASQQHVEGDRDDVAILSTSEVEVPEPVVAGQDGAVAAIEPDAVIVSADLVTRAQQTAARVTFIEDPTLLAEVGGVGAFLRYRVTPQTTDSAPQPQHA